METLDRFDIAILNELQNDGRLSNAELAIRVGLSAAPCWRRVRALEESGFITGYRAELDRRRMGLGVFAFVRAIGPRKAIGARTSLAPLVEKFLGSTGTNTYVVQSGWNSNLEIRNAAAAPSAMRAPWTAAKLSVACTSCPPGAEIESVMWPAAYSSGERTSKR